MSEDERTLMIEDFLLDRMSAAAARDFEQSMEQDPALAEEVARYHLALDAEKLLWKNKLDEKIKTWNEDTAKNAQRHQRYLWWGIPLLLIIGYGVSLSLRPAPDADPANVPKVALDTMTSWGDSASRIISTPSDTPATVVDTPSLRSNPMAMVEPPLSTPQAQQSPAPAPSGALLAVAEFYQPISDITRSASLVNNDTLSLLNKADKAYEAKDFSTAIALYEQILPNDNAYLLAQETIGHAAMQIDDYDRAIAAFEQYQVLSSYPDSENADWYLLLAYLAEVSQHQEDFDTLANKILADELHNYQAPTQRLINQLKK